METVCQYIGPETEIYLFGSRINDNAKGGDVDLLIETPAAVPLVQRAQIKMQLELFLGLPVDLVYKTKAREATAFQTIARNHAVRLSIES